MRTLKTRPTPEEADVAAKNVLGRIVPHEFYSLITAIDSELEYLEKKSDSKNIEQFANFVRSILTDVSTAFSKALGAGQDQRLIDTIQDAKITIRPMFRKIEEAARGTASGFRSGSAGSKHIAEVRYQANRGGAYLEGVLRILTALDRDDDVTEHFRMSSEHESAVNIRQLISRVERRMYLAGQLANARFFVEDTLPTVYGDEALLFTVFRNLLSNAIKYAKPNLAPKVWVGVRSQGAPIDQPWAASVLSEYDRVFERSLEGKAPSEIRARRNRVNVIVLDNGIGISQKIGGRVFRPLNRGSLGMAVVPENLIDIDNKGLGIGLTAAQLAMQMHGGDLTVGSIEGLGSVFVASFPRERLKVDRSK